MKGEALKSKKEIKEDAQIRSTSMKQSKDGMYANIRNANTGQPYILKVRCFYPNAAFCANFDSSCRTSNIDVSMLNFPTPYAHETDLQSILCLLHRRFCTSPCFWLLMFHGFLSLHFNLQNKCKKVGNLQHPNNRRVRQGPM